ncbi:class I SAM-dependent methyltransferase [Flavobacteriales bacterium]|nr:class I SAM-dependent methyltransferase [Flavobacteriales bacterium]
MTERKKHWETVYETKTPDQVSWTQDIPQTSLDFINSFGLPKNANIIDVGGGDSNLVDHLIEAGYKNITVLDISGKAIERAKKRLGEKADSVIWIESDVTQFTPDKSYDIWHDRATFHFLTSEDQINSYKNIVSNHVSGFMSIGTFSNNGPLKCSGLEISQYTSDSLLDAFNESFELTNSIIEDHKTPFDTFQNFVFCGFKKK